MTYPETARAQKQTAQQPARHLRPHHSRACPCLRGSAPRRGPGLPQGPETPAGADDRDRRRHRHRPVHGRRRPPRRRRPGPDHQLCRLRVLRLHDPARPRRTRDAPAVVGLVRLLCPRILRREGRVRHRLAVLAELGHDGDRGHHRRRAVHELLQEVLGADRGRTAVGLGPGRPDPGPGPQPHQRQGVRRARILVRADQGGGARVLPDRRHLLRHLRHPRRRPGGRLQPDRGQRRHVPQRPAARHRGDAGRRVRLRLDRADRHRRRRDGKPGKDHAAGHQHGDRPYRGVLRRLAGTALAAAALQLLQGRRKPVRDVLRLHRRRRRGRHHEPRGPDRGTVLAQRRPLLHRPDHAVHVRCQVLRRNSPAG